MSEYLYAVIRDLGAMVRKERARADGLESQLANYSGVSNDTSGGLNVAQRSTQGRESTQESEATA